MPRRASAKRYAQAAFQLALEQGQQEQWADDLDTINESFQVEEFRSFLEHARVPPARKVQVIHDAFPGVDPLLQNMLSLLVSRGLVELVPEVQAEFRHLLDELKGREQVDVWTAVPLQDAERDRITRFLAELRNKEVVLDTRVDPIILGGLVIRMGDKLIDGSTRTRLQELGKLLQRDATRAGA